MKHLFLSVSIVLAAGWSFAQTDPLNLQKYWKLRDNFREQFVKIGPGDGESITARALKPLECVDNYTADGTSENHTPHGNGSHGEMHFGDAMIRHGYYLGLLATEYRLLKDAGQDVTGVKNELFYALNAINRLDFIAEEKQGLTYFTDFDPSLNGFYMREDIPEDFAEDNWGSSKFESRCVNSPHYKTNNAAHSNEGGPHDFQAHGNSYQNSPSSDQFSSLMLGFSLIHKLVDPTEFVQPPGSEFGFYLVGETQNIVHRMMTYLEDHNWTMIDVNGWPVNNGGGDLSWANYPLCEAATRITGQTYNKFWRRRLAFYVLNNVQYCITGYGKHESSPAGRDDACDAIIDPVQSGAYDELVLGGIVGPANNQDFSIFQEWSDDGFGTIGRPIGFSEDTWNGDIEDFIDDVADDGKISSFNFPFNTVQYFVDDTENDRPSTIIISNYGVISGLWSGQTLNSLTDITGNVELELINAIIRNEAAPNNKSYYQAFLNSMSMTGPYNITSEVGSAAMFEPAGGGWGSEHRWTWTSDIDGGQNCKGMFNGLDYMLFHNLYYLKFNTGMPQYKPVGDCFCEETPQISTIMPDPYPLNPGFTQQVYEALTTSINQKLQFLNTCTEDVFAPVSHNVVSTLNVQPYFPDYVDLGIYTTKFQKENATVSSTGDVNIRTTFKICNAKTLTIQTGGRMDIEKAATIVGYNAKIDNSGDIVVKSGTTLTVEALGKLILRSGSKLIIEANAKVIIEEGAFIEYYGGASIIMHEPTSQLRLGSTIKVMDAGEFTISHTGSSAGKLVVTSPTAALLTATANVGKFKFVGKGINDPLIILEPNTKLWAMNNFTQSLTIQQCKIVFGAGAAFQCDQPFYTASVEFNSTATNGGLTLAEGSLMNSSRFINVPLFAKMHIENKGTLEMYNCYLLADSPTLNPANQALVEVTGRGYKIGTCNFYTTKNYGLYSTNLTLASTIGAGSVQYNGTLPASHLLTGVYDNSTVETSVNSVTITNCNTGVKKAAGKLTLRCNTFTANKDANVYAGGSSHLNMNSTTLGGYNKLYKTTNNKNIVLAAAAIIDIKTGFNYIEYTGVANTTIAGATNSYCSSCPTLDFSGNQWNATNKSPINIASVYNASGTVQYAYTTAPTALWQTCPASNVPTPPDDPNGKSLVDEDGMPIIYSGIVGDSTRLDEMVYRASEKMSMYNDSTANDLEAVDLLNDVFIADLDKSDSITNYWSWFALDQMKAALESAFANDQLNIGDNTSSFDPYVTKYAHAMMVMSDSVIDGNNYERQFIHEINKAHLMRVVGHSDIGFNILTELEACGLDSAEQAHLNYWKQEFEKDLVIEEIGFAAIDSVIVIDTNDYLNPALVVNAYSFGAIIHNLNDIQYPNCSFFNHRDTRTSFGSVQVFPNPATDEVRIAWNHPLMEGEGVVQIQQADGRVVLTKKINANESTGITVRVSDWNPGVYQIKYRSPKGTVSTAQLVVQ
ncbi:MAG: T9SS type A sorting domain-containing protein [Bacteroidota bacterium]